MVEKFFELKISIQIIKKATLLIFDKIFLRRILSS